MRSPWLLLLLLGCNNKSASSPPHADVTAPSVASPATTAPSTAVDTVAADGGTTKCGDATCAPGEYCCNESCSICAPKDGSCILTVCDRKDRPPKTSCASDADCATWSSYCGDLPCACLAVEKRSGPPKCNQPNAVKCLVDPCLNKAAACQGGTCVVTAK